MKGPAHGRALQSWCRLASAALVVMTLDLVVLARLVVRAVLGREGAVSLDLVARLVVRTVLGRERAVSLDLVAGLIVGTVLGRERAVALDLVAWLIVGTVLRREGAVALDLGLLVLALLVRHCSSFRSCCASFGRCQLSRRVSVDESSHRPFKFATAPAILLA